MKYNEQSTAIESLQAIIKQLQCVHSDELEVNEVYTNDADEDVRDDNLEERQNANDSQNLAGVRVNLLEERLKVKNFQEECNEKEPSTKKQIEDLTAEVSDLRGKLEYEEEKSTYFSQELKQISEHYVECTEELEEAKKEKEKMSDELENKEKVIDDATATLIETSKEVKDMSSAYAAMEKMLQKEEKSSDFLSEKTLTLKHDLAKEKLKSNEMSSEIKSLNALNQEYSEEIKNLANSCNSLVTEVNKVKLELDEKENELEEREAKIIKLVQEKDVKEQQVNEEQKQRELLENHVENMKKKYSKASENLTETEELLETCRDKIVSMEKAMMEKEKEIDLLKLEHNQKLRAKKEDNLRKDRPLAVKFDEMMAQKKLFVAEEQLMKKDAEIAKLLKKLKDTGTECNQRNCRLEEDQMVVNQTKVTVVKESIEQHQKMTLSEGEKDVIENEFQKESLEENKILNKKKHNEVKQMIEIGREQQKVIFSEGDTKDMIHNKAEKQPLEERKVANQRKLNAAEEVIEAEREQQQKVIEGEGYAKYLVWNRNEKESLEEAKHTKLKEGKEIVEDGREQRKNVTLGEGDTKNMILNKPQKQSLQTKVMDQTPLNAVNEVIEAGNGQQQNVILSEDDVKDKYAVQMKSLEEENALNRTCLNEGKEKVDDKSEQHEMNNGVKEITEAEREKGQKVILGEGDRKDMIWSEIQEQSIKLQMESQKRESELAARRKLREGKIEKKDSIQDINKRYEEIAKKAAERLKKRAEL